MDAAHELSEFLRSRRDRLAPGDVGLAFGSTGRRRVPGLRREEVALLAGISVEYYVQIERGRVGGVSEEVLDSISRALRLGPLEHEHLLTVARSLSHENQPEPSPLDRVRPTTQAVLDSITTAVAFVRNRRNDFLAGNRLALSLYSPVLQGAVLPVSLPRFVFLNETARSFYRRWNDIAIATAGSLRYDAAREPADGGMAELIAELNASSDDFRALWTDHHIAQYRSGIQYFRHPVAGDLDLNYETFELTTDAGQVMVVYTAATAASQRLLLELVDA